MCMCVAARAAARAAYLLRAVHHDDVVHERRGRRFACSAHEVAQLVPKEDAPRVEYEQYCGRVAGGELGTLACKEAVDIAAAAATAAGRHRESRQHYRLTDNRPELRPPPHGQSARPTTSRDAPRRAFIMSLAATVRTALESRLPARLGAMGLDVSTRHTGIAIVSPWAGLVHSEVVSSVTDEDPVAFGDRVAAAAGRAAAAFPVAVVGVEDCLKGFSGGRYNTQGLFKLARLNGIVTYAVWQRTGRPVALHTPNAIRAYFGIDARAVRAASLEAAEAAAAGDCVAAVADAAAGASTSDAETAAFNGSAPPGRSGSSPPRDDAVKLAVLAYVRRLFPALPVERGRTGALRRTVFDRSDAVLTALYVLARDAEAAALDDDSVLRTACEGALRARHSAARQRRAAPAAGAVAVECDAGQGFASDTGQARRLPRRRTAAVVAASVTAAEASRDAAAATKEAAATAAAVAEMIRLHFDGVRGVATASAPPLGAHGDVTQGDASLGDSVARARRRGARSALVAAAAASAARATTYGAAYARARAAVADAVKGSLLGEGGMLRQHSGGDR